MEFESRIRDFIFSWDIHNFINNDNIDDKLEDFVDALLDNKIKHLSLKDDFVKNANEDNESKIDLIYEVANYLKESGRHIVVLETPMPKNIRKEDEKIKSWNSYGFGLCRITVFVLNGFEYLSKEIEETENEIFEEIYSAEQKANLI